MQGCASLCEFAQNALFCAVFAHFAQNKTAQSNLKSRKKRAKRAKFCACAQNSAKFLHRFCAFFAKQRKNFAQILRIFRKAAQKFCTDSAHFPLNTANLLRRFSVFFKEFWIEFYLQK
jgi:hypothetical protein